MKEQVKERIKVWKRFYAGQTTAVDENSSWADILLKLNLSHDDSVKLGKQAIEQCMPFNFEEMLFLGNLPLYQVVKELVATMPNSSFGNCFGATLPHGDVIYFMRYPKLEELQKGDNLLQVPVVVATIVYHHPVDFDAEVYAWCNLHKNAAKHLIIRYANEKPADFILPQKNQETDNNQSF